MYEFLLLDDSTGTRALSPLSSSSSSTTLCVKVVMTKLPHYSGQYSDERHKRGHGQLQPYGYSDSSTNKQTTSYEYEDGGYPQSQPYGSSSSKTIKQSYEMSSDGPWVTDGKNSYAGSKDVNMKKEVTNQSSA
jgi:hypothetical protein